METIAQLRTKAVEHAENTLDKKLMLTPDQWELLKVAMDQYAIETTKETLKLAADRVKKYEGITIFVRALIRNTKPVIEP